MKRLILISVLSLSLLGCAASSETRPESSFKSIDQSYVNAVEYQARRAGVRVEWVNPPRASESELQQNQR
ncbi:hypothetical protein [Wenzhouxiangella marina]|uniref:Uncharacterized protein n=1 Tax=Wenzhouxiangella marina TaxID=1579979 RepID=A0A0K0XSM4_9GAMM|nr:hypothetical protein [Wenzhouxiangella marina]AKS40627.1 hypothetical protein WM2015_238 [Wenzhouxiangella marina]MBB6088395.1 hypothetical protein [Wenzhouxiangella marina]